MRRTPSPFVGHHHVTRAKFRSLVKYGAVVLAISFFFGALLLVRTTDLLWQAGDVISPGQLVSGIHVLSTAIGLDLFSEEYNLRLLTEDPDPYWVREWESKRGFAEALQRGLHEAQDRYLAYALLHTYADDEHAAWRNLTAYKDKNPNYTVKWAIRRMVRGARRTAHSLPCSPWEAGLVPAKTLARRSGPLPPMPDEHVATGMDPAAERIGYAKQVRDQRGYCFGGAAIPDTPRVCDVYWPDYREDGTRVLYNTTFAIYPYWHRARAYTDPKTRAGLIAVTTQGTVDRVSHLSNLVRIWQGPVSFAVLATESQIIDELPALLYTDPEVADHVDIHVVYRTSSPPGAEPFYPINMLRNVALATVWADHAFVLDIDNVPNANMASYASWVANAQTAASAIENQDPSECPGLFAFVPPAVEMQASTLEGLYARSKVRRMVPKRLLMEGFLFGDVKPMHMYYAPAYMPTNHYEWVTSRQVVETKYLARHEPYYIARMPIPFFNESFVNRGGNYAQQVYEMNVGGYRFFRMPYAFVIDIPHTHPYDELKKNSSSLVDEDHATELSANETPLVPSAANQQAFLPTDVATSPNDVAPNQAQQTNGNGEANATAAAANQAAAPAGNLTTNLAALSHELPGNGSANGTLDTDSTATPQPAPQSQSVSSNQLPPVVASPPANENTPGLTRHRRQQPLHMLVNDSPQQVLNQDFIKNLWDQLWADLPHRYQYHVPSPDAQEPVFRRYRTTMTKLSNDLFAALAKPGSQDEDPNYVIDYDTPE